MEQLLLIARVYDIPCIKSEFEKFLMKHLRGFALSELTKLAETFHMDELSQLCKLVKFRI